MLDSVLKQAREQSAINVNAVLKHARTQRNHLVQTEVRGRGGAGGQGLNL